MQTAATKRKINKRIRRKVQDDEGDYFIQGFKGRPVKVKRPTFQQGERLADKLMNNPKVQNIFFRQRGKTGKTGAQGYLEKERQDVIKKGLAQQLLKEKYKGLFPGLFDARLSALDSITGNIAPAQMDEADQLTMKIGDQLHNVTTIKRLKKGEADPKNSIIFENNKGQIYSVPIDFVNQKIALQAFGLQHLLDQSLKDKQQQLEEVDTRLNEAFKNKSQAMLKEIDEMKQHKELLKRDAEKLLEQQEILTKRMDDKQIEFIKRIPEQERVAAASEFSKLPIISRFSPYLKMKANQFAALQNERDALKSIHLMRDKAKALPEMKKAAENIAQEREEVLKEMETRHNVLQKLKTIITTNKAGKRKVNFDLMYEKLSQGGIDDTEDLFKRIAPKGSAKIQMDDAWQLLNDIQEISNIIAARYKNTIDELQNAAQ